MTNKQIMLYLVHLIDEDRQLLVLVSAVP